VRAFVGLSYGCGPSANRGHPTRIARAALAERIFPSHQLSSDDARRPGFAMAVFSNVGSGAGGRRRAQTHTIRQRISVVNRLLVIATLGTRLIRRRLRFDFKKDAVLLTDARE